MAGEYRGGRQALAAGKLQLGKGHGAPPARDGQSLWHQALDLARSTLPIDHTRAKNLHRLVEMEDGCTRPGVHTARLR
jgi:hypothetical protein